MSVGDVLRRTVELKADCIHLEPTSDGGQIRLRIDGRMTEPQMVASDEFHALLDEVRELSHIEHDQRRPQDGLLRVEIDDTEYRIHVSAIRSTHGQTMVLKILLSPNRAPLNLNELGLLDRQLAQLKRILQSPRGMIVHTGPCGSGKSTTQYAVLNYLKSPRRRVVTIEDYHERSLDGIQQHIVDYSAGMTFSRLTLAVARGRPDVMLVSEMRDWETMERAVLAAGPRTLVIAGLHTIDAASAYSRMIDVGAPPGLVASTVMAVIAQRLVGRICEACKISYPATRSELHHLRMPKNAHVELSRGAGCNECRYTGFSGRIGVFDILEPNEAVRELVRNMSPTKLIREEVAKQDENRGTVLPSSRSSSFLNSGNELAINGLTTLAEVYRCVPRHVEW